MKTNTKQVQEKPKREIEWDVRYKVIPHFPFGFCVYFEDETNLGWYLNKWHADAMAGQLNGAFNLGKSTAYLELGEL
jgi:hypothetical protein